MHIVTAVCSSARAFLLPVRCELMTRLWS